MKPKSNVVQEAEEIIADFMKRQDAIARTFRIKNKRKIHGGTLLLLMFGISIFFLIVLFFVI